MPNLNKDSYSFDANDAQNEAQNDAQNEAQNDAQNDAQNEAQKSSIHEMIISLVKANPRITRKQMATQIGVSKATIERELSKFKDIRFVGPSKTGHWEIAEEEKGD